MARTLVATPPGAAAPRSYPPPPGVPKAQRWPWLKSGAEISRSERLRRWREEEEESDEDDVVFVGAMVVALKRKKTKKDVGLVSLVLNCQYICSSNMYVTAEIKLGI
ncbi:unnamed protein product [Urochloa humidicola]